MTILRNNRLSINIDKPGETYLGSRFDWTGFITQITLDNEFTFCVPEQLEKGKGSGGVGFCNEFGIDMPIGYEQAEVGESFPKIGVGLLTKDADIEYDFFRKYSIEKAMFTEMKTSDVEYRVSSEIKNSKYDISLTKKITLEENRLFVNYTLINKGKNPIKTNEYCHNFIGINKLNDSRINGVQLTDKQVTDNRDIDSQIFDGQFSSEVKKGIFKKIGEDQILEFPNTVSINVKAGQCEVDKNTISWTKKPEEDFYAIIELHKGITKVNWNFYDKVYQVGVRDYSDLKISKCALWGTTHVVSPELFVPIDLSEGETMQWERIYEFYQGNQ